MPQPPMNIHDDSFLAPAGLGEGGVGAMHAAEVWKSETGHAKVGVWKAEPGRYGAANRPYCETFIVVDGEADVTIGNAPPLRVSAGSIVHIPARAHVRFDVLRTLAKFSAAVQA